MSRATRYKVVKALNPVRVEQVPSQERCNDPLPDIRVWSEYCLAAVKWYLADFSVRRTEEEPKLPSDKRVLKTVKGTRDWFVLACAPVDMQALLLPNGKKTKATHLDATSNLGYSEGEELANLVDACEAIETALSDSLAARWSKVPTAKAKRITAASYKPSEYWLRFANHVQRAVSYSHTRANSNVPGSRGKTLPDGNVIGAHIEFKFCFIAKKRMRMVCSRMCGPSRVRAIRPLPIEHTPLPLDLSLSVFSRSHYRSSPNYSLPPRFASLYFVLQRSHACMPYRYFNVTI